MVSPPLLLAIACAFVDDVPPSAHPGDPAEPPPPLVELRQPDTTDGAPAATDVPDVPDVPDAPCRGDAEADRQVDRCIAIVGDDVDRGRACLDAIAKRAPGTCAGEKARAAVQT